MSGGGGGARRKSAWSDPRAVPKSAPGEMSADGFRAPFPVPRMRLTTREGRPQGPRRRSGGGRGGVACVPAGLGVCAQQCRGLEVRADRASADAVAPPLLGLVRNCVAGRSAGRLRSPGFRPLGCHPQRASVPTSAACRGGGGRTRSF